MHGRKRAKRSFYRQSLEARKKRKVQRTNHTNLQTRRNTARESSLSATYKNESGQDTRGSDVKWSG